MKKFLALVLALVMTMSLVTISAGAEFTDDASITYEEAVDVMTAVGVVGGYADGTFNPTAGLTRGAAAKIICNMLLGPTTAEALVANDAPFSDVAADNVFAGYIAYCVNEGIISGYADGTFKPAAPLTGYAFMKMLLGALGYDAEIEGYTGSNWSIQVAKRALNLKLTKGLEGAFNGSKALNREEACLYAFNTMKAGMVEYSNKSTISVGDLVISQSSEAKPANVLFRVKYFDDLKVGGASTDAYGRPAHEWVYDKESVGVYADAPIVSYTEATKYSVIVDDLKDAGYKAVATGFSGTNPFTATASNKEGGQGVLVEYYGAENATTGVDEVTKIVTINTYIAQVTNIVKDKTSTKDDDRAFTINDGNGYVKTIKFVDEQIANFDEIYNSIEKKDWVLFTKDTAAQVETVLIPETIEGVVSKYAAGVATVDGAAYNTYAGVTVSPDTGAQTLWLDTYGNIIKGELVDTTSDVVYLVDAYTEYDNWNVASHYARVVTEDGEVVVLETASLETVGANRMKTYTTDSDGIATLVNATGCGGVNTTTYPIDDDDATLDSKYWADGVKFVFVKGDKSDLEVTTAAGVQKVSNKNVKYVTNEDGEIAVVFVIGGQGAAAAEDLLFVKDNTAEGTATDKKGFTGSAYELYIAGVKATEIVTGLNSTNKLYTYSIDAETGKYLAVAESNAATATIDAATIAQDKFVTVGGTCVNFVLADDCAIYDLTDNGMTTLAEIDALFGEGTMTLKIAVAFDTNDKEISTLYVWEA